jgi:hypothetical protein
MAAPKITTSSCWAGNGFALLARYKDLAGNDVQQADVSSISYEVWPKSNPRLVQTGTFTVADVVFNTLQTGSGWNSSEYPDGYNFRGVLPATLFPKEEETYRIFIRVVPASGVEADPIVHDRRTHGKTG